jgi:hypothetical protein
MMAVGASAALGWVRRRGGESDRPVVGRGGLLNEPLIKRLLALG